MCFDLRYLYLSIHNYVLKNKNEASLSRMPGTRVPELEEGQHVMLIRHQGRKLDPKMTGPFRIREVVAKYLVELEDADNKNLGRHFVGNLRDVNYVYSQTTLISP